MQRKKGSKRIQVIIKRLVNEFKLTVFHLRAQTRCKSVHARGFTAGQQNCVGLRAAGPRGRRTTGPPGRGGPWAAGRWAVAGRGLLLAKPELGDCGLCVEFAHFLSNFITLERKRKLTKTKPCILPSFDTDASLFRQ